MHWVVGDIQGCARELDDLLGWVRFDAGRDTLWCLGDLVNRGPDSIEALRLWRDVEGRSLLGNHDLYALLAHAGRRARKPDTLDRLFAAGDAPALLARLRSEPLLVRLEPPHDERPIWLVHAGLHPAWQDLEATAERLNALAREDDGLESEDVSFVTRVRCCDALGERCKHTGPPATCPPPYRPWDAFYRGEALVVHGHWAQRGAYRTARTMGLDSGCVYGGTLSAWCPEEERLVQIPARSRGGRTLDFDARRLGG